MEDDQHLKTLLTPVTSSLSNPRALLVTPPKIFPLLLYLLPNFLQIPSAPFLSLPSVHLLPTPPAWLCRESHNPPLPLPALLGHSEMYLAPRASVINQSLWRLYHVYCSSLNILSSSLCFRYRQAWDSRPCVQPRMHGEASHHNFWQTPP